MEQKNNYKMSIKARVNAPSSIMSRDAERYNGQTVEIIDFVATTHGLIAVALLEVGKDTVLYPFNLCELLIIKQ